MAKIEITNTELAWPGKYDEDGKLEEVPRVAIGVAWLIRRFVG